MPYVNQLEPRYVHQLHHDRSDNKFGALLKKSECRFLKTVTILQTLEILRRQKKNITMF